MKWLSLPHRPVLRFVVMTLLWLPFSFFIWYRLAEVWCWPVGWALAEILPTQYPGLVAGVEIRGAMLDVVVNYTPAEFQIMDKTADLVATINPLTYGYGLPLLIALIIASPGTEGGQWLRGLLGYAVLGMVQLFGCYFEGLMLLQFQMPDAVASRLDYSPWQRDLIALGYQMGSLILPAVSPIVLWFACYPHFPATLVQRPDAALRDQ